jgi:DNA-binding transcriptional LysR family regulator
VASGQYDLGLAADEIDTSGILHHPFTNATALCAIPSGHPLARRETISPADLVDEPLIAFVPEDRGRQRMDRIFMQAGLVPRIVVETLYASTVCALVSEGIGIGFVSAYSVGGMDCSRLALKPFTPAIHIKSLLLLPQDRPKSALVRDLINCLLSLR